MSDASDYDFTSGPMPVAHTMPLSTLEYILRLNQLGMIEGPVGDQKLAPEVEKLVWALHNFLAGGEIEINIKRKGNPDIVRQLETMVEKAHADSNLINKGSGYYVTAMI